MLQNRKYDHEYKIQTVKLIQEIGSPKVAKELGIPADTLYGWIKAVKEGWLDIGSGAHTQRMLLHLMRRLLNFVSK